MLKFLERLIDKRIERKLAMLRHPASRSVLNFTADDGCIPQRAHLGDAGRDLKAAENTYLSPRMGGMVGTGVKVAVPHGHVGLVFERSSLHRRGLTLENKVGVIDPGYEGEIMLALRNVGDEGVLIEQGERLAQIMVVPLATHVWRRVPTLPGHSARGEGGFGSTGAK